MLNVYTVRMKNGATFTLVSLLVINETRINFGKATAFANIT